jgi:hypothetical protein
MGCEADLFDYSGSPNFRPPPPHVTSGCFFCVKVAFAVPTSTIIHLVPSAPIETLDVDRSIPTILATSHASVAPSRGVILQFLPLPTREQVPADHVGARVGPVCQ